MGRDRTGGGVGRGMVVWGGVDGEGRAGQCTIFSIYIHFCILFPSHEYRSSQFSTSPPPPILMNCGFIWNVGPRANFATIIQQHLFSSPQIMKEYAGDKTVVTINTEEISHAGGDTPNFISL